MVFMFTHRNAHGRQVAHRLKMAFAAQHQRLRSGFRVTSRSLIDLFNESPDFRLALLNVREGLFDPRDRFQQHRTGQGEIEPQTPRPT